jgi:hypothetical protein
MTKKRYGMKYASSSVHTGKVMNSAVSQVSTHTVEIAAPCRSVFGKRRDHGLK